VVSGYPGTAAPPQFMAKSRHQVFPAIKADAALKEVPAAPGLSRNDSVREHGRFSGARQTTGKVSTTRSRQLWQIRRRLRPRVLRLPVGPNHLNPSTITHGVAYINSGELRARSCLTSNVDLAAWNQAGKSGGRPRGERRRNESSRGVAAEDRDRALTEGERVRPWPRRSRGWLASQVV